MPVPDRPGVLAEVTTLAGRRGVNIVDLDISHGPTGGVLVMVVPAAGADAIVGRPRRARLPHDPRDSGDRHDDASRPDCRPSSPLAGPRPLRGRLRVPGDKSISHRALLFAALATGTSRLWGLADGDDVVRSRAAIERARRQGPRRRRLPGEAAWPGSGSGRSSSSGAVASTGSSSPRPSSTAATPGPRSGCWPGSWPAGRSTPC